VTKRNKKLNIKNKLKTWSSACLYIGVNRKKITAFIGVGEGRHVPPPLISYPSKTRTYPFKNLKIFGLSWKWNHFLEIILILWGKTGKF